MYGLLLDALHRFILKTYGKEAWNMLRKKANVDFQTFNSMTTYSETLLVEITTTMSLHFKISLNDLMFQVGEYFVEFLTCEKHGNMMRVLGRTLREFLDELDNLHRYLTFKFPKLSAPFFTCASESRSGITLQYSSYRRGYIHYVRGIISALSLQLFSISMHIEVICESEEDGLSSTIYRLHFANGAGQIVDDHFKLPVTVFFDILPFSVLFNRSFRIVTAGKGILRIVPNLIDDHFTNQFLIESPIITLTWENVLTHCNNVFEVTHFLTEAETQLEKDEMQPERKRTSSNWTGPMLKMRGQMKYMLDLDAIVYIASPIMRDVDDMHVAQISLEDLSLHDSSRRLLLIGEQQSAEMKLAIREKKNQFQELEKMSLHAKEETEKTENLVYQMIPKRIAEGLRQGVPAVDMSENFSEVSILFTDIVEFTVICSRLDPLQVVTMLSNLFSKFDALTIQHNVYKVETIGDAYVIASGCPATTKLHAAFIAEIAFDLRDCVKETIDPSVVSGESLRIRIGCHSGPVMAGVVGHKMPRYCLFGETVTTANLMESSGMANRIHVSETLHQHLEKTGTYHLTYRGEMETPGKHTIKTYWLERNLKNALAISKLTESLAKERESLADSNVAINQTRLGESWQSSSNTQSISTRGSSRKLSRN